MTESCHLSHKQLVRLIGEIDAISIESEPSPESQEVQDLVVYLEINGHRIELIRTVVVSAGLISHVITRSGIRQQLDHAL